MTLRTFLLVAVIVLVGCSDRGTTPTPGEFGAFVGKVKTEWLDDGRNMELLEDFAYLDQAGVKWAAPQGSKIDGASIPRGLWTVAGSPFTGCYRRASVVHDVACDEKKKPWQDVHLMFYGACRAGGCDEDYAKTLYWAVYHFGPRWSPSGQPIVAAMRFGPTEEELAEVKAFAETSKPTLEQLRNYTPRAATRPR